MAVDGCFAAAQAVGGAKLDPIRTATGDVAVAAGDAGAGSEPEMTAGVFKNRANRGLGGVVAVARRGGKAPAIPQVPAAVLGADEHSVAVGQERGNNVAGEAVGCGVVFNFAIAEAGEAGEGG